MKLLYVLIATLIITLLGIGIILYLANGIQNTSLENFELESINEINTNSFTLNGSFYIKNPSKLSIPVKSINYDIILEENEEKISSGKIPRFKLEGESTTRIPFKQKVDWVPTAQLASQLLTKEHAYADINGTIKIGLPIINQYEIPFEKRIDLKEYTNQFIEENTNAESVQDLSQRVRENPREFIPLKAAKELIQ